MSQVYLCPSNRSPHVLETALGAEGRQIESDRPNQHNSLGLNAMRWPRLVHLPSTATPCLTKGRTPNSMAFSPAYTDLVVAIDLSRSVDVKGPDGSTEFQKNVEGVSHLLAEVSPGTHVTVFGITDRSFAQPYVPMSASVPDDAGYFGARIAAARQALVQAWKERSANLVPKFPGKEILGALELASQIFNQPDREQNKMLTGGDSPEMTTTAFFISNLA